MSTPVRRFAVYDGTTCLGSITETDDGFQARDPAGRSYGLFNTVKAASAALPLVSVSALRASPRGQVGHEVQPPDAGGGHGG